MTAPEPESYTLLFNDIAGSTNLYEAFGDAAANCALATQRRDGAAVAVPAPPVRRPVAPYRSVGPGAST